LKCKECGEEFKKVEMIEYEEIAKYIGSERKAKKIEELKPEDVVIILFDRKMMLLSEEKPTSKKSYLRKVEKIDKKKIKIKGLSKYFDKEYGEMKIVPDEPDFGAYVNYKIKIIDEEEENILRVGISEREKYNLTEIIKKLTEKRKREETNRS